MIGQPWSDIAAAIRDLIDGPFEPDEVRHVGGGCINQAVRLSDGRRHFFIKVNEPSALSMFEAERDGLRALDAARAVRVPTPLTAGAGEGVSFLVLEYIDLNRLSGAGWARLGEQLAATHRATADRFGWHRDNTIGATPQPNDWTESWLEFWRRHRLGYQLRLAADHGLPASAMRDAERLMGRLETFFPGYRPVPSLLHGDLWGGNVAGDDGGRPVLFDPAVYYGDREADIAMTELFGRFDRRFYEAYDSAWPMDPGYGQRRTLYNLYHVLNHFNLFGGGYAAQAGSMIHELLAAS